MGLRPLFFIGVIMAQTVVPPNFYYNIATQNQKDPSDIHKFGRANVSTTYVPIALGNTYQTPQVGSETQLRIAAGDANDAPAGTGARKIYLEGLNASGELITDEIETNGISAGTASTESFLRLFRFYVSESGTYATSSAGSHAADIVIENSAGGTTWGTIDSSGFPRGQSEVAAYSVPLGYKAYIQNIFISVQDTKTVSVLGFQRNGILKTSAPYDAMRSFVDLGTIQGEEFLTPKTPIGPFNELTDLGFMGRLETGGGTAEIDIDMEIILDQV